MKELWKWINEEIVHAAAQFVFDDAKDYAEVNRQRARYLGRTYQLGRLRTKRKRGRHGH